VLIRLLVVGVFGLASVGSLYVGDEPPRPSAMFKQCYVTADCVYDADCLPAGTSPNNPNVTLSVCSVPCETSDDCPEGGVCVDPGGDFEKLCLESCEAGCEDCCDEFIVCRPNRPPEPVCRP
jgi:hypothetical protein